MNNPQEDIGYKPIDRSKERVSIVDYGKTALAEKGKEEVKRLLRELKAESDKLGRLK